MQKTSPCLEKGTNRRKDSNLKLMNTIQKQHANTMLKAKKKELDGLLVKNEVLVEGVPQFIATSTVKQRLLVMRKNLMIRQMYADIRCKIETDWNQQNIARQM